MSEAAIPAHDPQRKLNRFSVPALVATILLCFPVGAVLAVVSLVQIRRSRRPGSPGPQEDGVLFALMALFVSSVLAPAVVVSALYGNPRMLDSCYYTQEEALGVLRVISYLEENHKKATGSYGPLHEIGFAPKIDTGPYDFAVQRYDEGRFLATATGNQHMDGDLLTVTESRNVERTRDICQLRRRQ